MIFVLIFVEIYGKKKELNRLLVSYIEINGIIAVIVGLFGAVLFQNLYDYIENPTSYKWSWSMTFYGGLIFGVLSFLLGYFLIIKRKFGPCLKDHILSFAPACVAIAQGFGRIGCFLSGCCYGKCKGTSRLKNNSQIWIARVELSKNVNKQVNVIVTACHKMTTSEVYPFKLREPR